MRTDELIALLWDWIVIQFQLILAATLGILVIVSLVALFRCLKVYLLDPVVDWMNQQR